MASSRLSLNRLDLTDVAVAWAAFEEINSVQVEIRVIMASRGAIHEPQLNGTATSTKAEHTAAAPLVLASVSVWAFSYPNLDIAVFHLLYALDGQIASAEFAGIGKEEA